MGSAASVHGLRDDQFEVRLAKGNPMKWNSKVVLEVETTMLNYIKPRRSFNRGLSSVNIRYQDMDKIEFDGTSVTVTPLHGTPLKATLSDGVDGVANLKRVLLGATQHGQSVQIISH